MIISSSTLQMNSQRKYEVKHSKGNNLTTWNSSGISNQNNYEMTQSKSFEQFAGRELLSSQENHNDELGEKETSGAEKHKNFLNGMTTKRNRMIQSMREETEKTTIRQQIVQYLLRWLFGESDKEYNRFMESFAETSAQQEAGGKEQSFESYSEIEETSFSTTGTIKTSDGREISLDVQVHMSRTFMSHYAKTTTFGAELIDPLVINTGSAVTSMATQSFYFDLDCDGKKEKVNALQSSSGFLALDKNSDGIINDGSELFGTKSGDGFADLALLDQDYNGWIDEADEVYHQLRIWYADGSEKPKLISLKEANIGAIYLGSATTNFALNDNRNESSAYVRNSGIFLYENGEVGTIQHVDMVKKDS